MEVLAGRSFFIVSVLSDESTRNHIDISGILGYIHRCLLLEFLKSPEQRVLYPYFSP